jgi:hypothetical protein
MNLAHETFLTGRVTVYLKVTFLREKLKKITKYHRQNNQERSHYQVRGVFLREYSGFVYFVSVAAKYDFMAWKKTLK